MEIIKHGKHTNLKTFECNCGCVFRVNSDEYMSYNRDYKETIYRCLCPECHDVVYLHALNPWIKPNTGNCLPFH